MILVVCLHPSLQRTLIFSQLVLNQVNRAKSVHVSPGGKGVNVARVIRQLGGDALLFLPLGGAHGRTVRTLLKNEGISFSPVAISSNTRICSTLLDSTTQSVTELVEESAPLTEKEMASIEKRFLSCLHRAQWLVLSGTAPSGFRETIYYDWILLARKYGILTFLDASGHWARNALAAHPWLLKCNWEEMEGILERKISLLEVSDSLHALQNRGAENVIVTCDGPLAYARVGDANYRIESEALQVVNSIGSGDAMMAGIVYHISNEKPLSEAIRFGMACAGANVLTECAGEVRPSDVYALFPRIRMIPI